MSNDFLNQQYRLSKLSLVPQEAKKLRAELESLTSPIEINYVSSPIKAIRFYSMYQLPSNGTLLYGTYQVDWPTSELKAVCYCPDSTCKTMAAHYKEDFPTAMCGIYSFKFGEEHVYSFSKVYPALAMVDLYGYVVELEKGYRSEYAKITSLYIDYSIYKYSYCKAHLVGMLKTIYKVPVSLVDETVPDNECYLCQITGI